MMSIKRLAFTLLAILPLLSLIRAESSKSVASFRPKSAVARASARLSNDDDVHRKRSQPSAATALLLRGGVENTLTNAIAGAVVLALIEKIVKKVFVANAIGFPSPLGACMLLLFTLLLTEKANADLANAIFTALSPGAGFLAKWLPVFFVPGLAMLPLAPSVGGPAEVAKVVLVAGLGFIYTLFTTSFAVLTLRQAQGAVVSAPVPIKATSSAAKTSTAVATKPFGDQTMDFFLKGSLAFGVASLVAKRADLELATPLQTLFFGFATVAAYVWGARLPTDFTKVVHPLVTSTVILMALVYATGLATGNSFTSVLKTYKVGSLDPMKAGAGDVLLYLLGPSVVSFAISMYSRRQLLQSNFLVVILAMFVSSAGGLFGTAAFVRAISLGGANGAMVRLSVLARNVTTALAIALTTMLGGDISIAASVVVLTGILGATYGKTILSAVGITDPVTRGLAIGSSSQGLGVASISDEPDAFPFAAVSMVLTAICATTLVSIPTVKDSIIKLATGS